MQSFTRRDFLQISYKLAFLMGLGSNAIVKISEAIADIAANKAPVLWLQAQSCSGCSVSLLNAEHPDPFDIITDYISLLFHSTLSNATGHVCIDIINKTIEKGDYILAVEGSIPYDMPEACVVGHETITSQIKRAAQKAKAILAIGTCASYGGIPAAEDNPTGAISLSEYLEKINISKPTILIPGCPSHPEWVFGTIVHTLKFGIPELDDDGRPVMFFKKLIHDHCPRFADYEREKFAKKFGDDGCLFKLGCFGPNTHADCTTRYWNMHVNNCIAAGAPCIGCTSKEFAKKKSFPFYRKNEKN